MSLLWGILSKAILTPDSRLTNISPRCVLKQAHARKQPN
jgi:hypothetical protein